MKSYLFQCRWEDEAGIFYIAADAENIQDARKIFERRKESLKRRRPIGKREFCLFRVYREV